MGRSVANEGFIRALLRRDPFDAYHFYLSDHRQLEILSDRLMQAFPDMVRDERFVLQTFAELPGALATHDFHCFHLSDCLLHNAPLASLRNHYSARIFPITGCTHTLSYARYLPMFLGHMWHGTCERDAIVATSRAAVSMVTAMFDHLRAGFGFSAPSISAVMPPALSTGAGYASDAPSSDCSMAFAQPHMERIPLGIDLTAFPFPMPERRTAVRSALGVGEDDVLLLVFARISHYSKMDLLPLLRALQRLAAARAVRTDSLHLVLAGYLQKGDPTPNILGGLAKALGIRLHIASSPSDDERNGLYAAADIFVSPVDNMQETFGLTLLEAGAMGLPVIASDYDGYRDLVIDGKTGLLVRTLGPSYAEDVDVMAHLAFDSATHLAMAQRTAVDIPALANALGVLIEDRTLRQTMGNAARAHVRACYGWDDVVDQYLALWERLNSTAVSEETLRRARHPLQMDYSRIFSSYPSATLDPEMTVVWSSAGEAVYRGKEQPVIYEGIASGVSLDTLRFMLFCARKRISVATLTALLAERAMQAGVNSGSPVLPVSETGTPEHMGNTDNRGKKNPIVNGSRFWEYLVLWALKHDFLERN